MSQRSSQDRAQSPVLSPQSFVTVAAGAGLAVIAMFASTGRYREAAFSAAALIALGWIVVAGLSAESLLIAWFALSPVASFYIRVPTDQSIVTFNRAMLLLAVGMVVARRKPPDRFVISKFEAAWGALCLVALASALTKSSDLNAALRIAVDSFCLPLVAFHLARYHFDLAGRGGAFLKSTMLLALFLLATGVYELATATDAFQFKGSELIREGERRVNGPFPADISFALISVLFALLLLALPRLFNISMDRTARLVYWLSIAAAAAASVLPKFRSVALALLAGGIIFGMSVARKRKVGLGAAVGSRAALKLGALVVVLLLCAAALVPSIFVSRLTDPRTAYGRLVTWKAAIEITIDHPFFGVGLGNYGDYFRSKYTWENDAVDEVSARDAQAADSPHSNWLWIAAEFGLFGFAMYAIANIVLLTSAWRALKSAITPRQKETAGCLLGVLVAYLIPGFTLASGYYSDLNLYFFFIAGLLLNLYANRRDQTIEATR
jgi:O-antigen ligase